MVMDTGSYLWVVDAQHTTFCDNSKENVFAGEHRQRQRHFLICSSVQWRWLLAKAFRTFHHSHCPCGPYLCLCLSFSLRTPFPHAVSTSHAPPFRATPHTIRPLPPSSCAGLGGTLDFNGTVSVGQGTGVLCWCRSAHGTPSSLTTPHPSSSRLVVV